MKTKNFVLHNISYPLLWYAKAVYFSGAPISPWQIHCTTLLPAISEEQRESPQGTDYPLEANDGNFEPREVRVGVRAEKMVEITAGLKAGDKVAAAANFLIDSEAKLKGVEPLPAKR